MADPIKFYIEGLTLTGFYRHIYNWVPIRGQRLRCSAPDGPISAYRESEVVGNVPKEVSPIFRKWLKAGGTLDAVVVSGKPRKHRTKGEEIYVNYLFTGDNKPLMINERNTIEKKIEKMMKRKKSLKFYHGDMSESPDRNITDRLVLQEDEENTGTIEFTVFGMALRGFHVYKEVWVPEIGSRHDCSISESGAVAVKYKDFEVCGHIPTDTQTLWRRFLNKGGEITAVIAGDPRNHRTKGEEVPATYVFKGTKTNVLSNLSNQIKGDIDKKKKKKKSLRLENGDATTETTQNNVSNNKVKNASTNNENKASGSKSSPNSSFNDRKRKVDESEDENETTEIKKKKMKSSSEPGTNRDMAEFEVGLIDEDMIQIAQQIGADWQSLGVVLGLKQVEVQQIYMDKCSGITYTIFNMLKLWQKTYPSKSTLGHFMNAIDKCTTLGIDKQGLNKLRVEILHKRCKENVEI